MAPAASPSTGERERTMDVLNEEEEAVLRRLENFGKIRRRQELRALRENSVIAIAEALGRVLDPARLEHRQLQAKLAEDVASARRTLISIPGAVRVANFKLRQALFQLGLGSKVRR